MTHDRVQALLSALIDGELDKETAQKVQEHLNACETCKAEYEELIFIHETMNDMPLLELPEGFEAELHEKLEATVQDMPAQEEQEAADMNRTGQSASTASDRKVIRIPLPSFKDFRKHAKPLTAVAATLLIAIAGYQALPLGEQVMQEAAMDSAPGEVGIRAAEPQMSKMDVNTDQAAVTFTSQAESGEAATFGAADATSYSLTIADAEPESEAVEATAEEAPSVQLTAQPTGAEQAPKSKAVDQRLLIYEASLNLEVEDYDAVYDRIHAEVKSRGGFVSEAETQYKYYDRENEEESLKHGWLTVRVPQEQFEQFLEGVQGMGRGPEPRVSARDITDQYRDLSSEVANLEVREKKLREIMEQAEEIKDVLEVERELSRVRGEINRYMGTLTQWDRLVQLSTIHIYLDEVESLKPVVKPIDKNIFQKAGDGFIETLNDVKQWFEAVFIGVVASIPVIILWAVGLGIGWQIVKRIWKRFRKSRRTTQEDKDA